MVNRREVLFMAMLATIVMVSCDSSPLEPTPVPITITVMEFYPDTASVPNASVTCLAGCQNQPVGTTDALGQTTLTGVEPLSIRVEKDGYISIEQQVFNGNTIAFEREPVEVTITVMEFYPDTASVPDATVTCLAGCQNQPVGTTDALGQTTLTGVEPLSVKVEKDGYIFVEQQVFNGDTIALEREPVEVTITVVEFYPDTTTTSVPNATVTCLAGCQNQPVGTTDALGQTTLTGVEPLSVKVEKDGYIFVEQQVFNGDTIALEREPPPDFMGQVLIPIYRQPRGTSRISQCDHRFRSPGRRTSRD